MSAFCSPGIAIGSISADTGASISIMAKAEASASASLITKVAIKASLAAGLQANVGLQALVDAGQSVFVEGEIFAGSFFYFTS